MFFYEMIVRNGWQCLFVLATDVYIRQPYRYLHVFVLNVQVCETQRSGQHRLERPCWAIVMLTLQDWLSLAVSAGCHQPAHLPTHGTVLPAPLCLPCTLPVDLNRGFRRIKSSSSSESGDLWTSPSPMASPPGEGSSSDVSLRKPGSEHGPSCSPAPSPQASHVASPSHSPFSSV